MSITIKSGAKVLYQWERGVALTASTPCDILRISREDDRVTDDLYPVNSGSTGTALIPDRMLTESGYLHISRIDHADGSERVLETVRILVRHAAKPQNTASSTKEIDDMQTIRMQMAALERAAREGKFDGKDGTTPHIGENGNWWLGNDDTGIAATGDDGITPHIGGNGNWYVGDTDTGVKATGDNGITPHIGANGNWFIGDVDTGVLARGLLDLPSIGANGNWFIGGADTGVAASGGGGIANITSDMVVDALGYIPVTPQQLEATNETAAAAQKAAGEAKTLAEGAAPTGHNQAASTITAGTFAGQVVAKSSAQTPGTALLRNSKIVSADTTPSNNGEICWTYK